MRPTPIESPSLFTALEAPLPAPERSREPSLPEPRAARFGQLFARVFGEQTRQPVAASGTGTLVGPGSAAQKATETNDATAAPETAADSNQDAPEASPAGLRALQIGEGTEIITAGPPPADEDLLRFARDAAMDEGSVAALLRHGRLVDWAGFASGRAGATAAAADDQSAEGLSAGSEDSAESSLTEGEGRAGVSKKTESEADLSLFHTAQEALILKGQEGLVSSRSAELAVASSAEGMPQRLSPGQTLGVGQAATRLMAAPPATLASPQSSGAGFSVSLAGGAAPPEMATSRWMQSRAGALDGAAGAAEESTSAEKADLAIVGASKGAELDPKAVGQARFDFEALRLRLGLEDQSTKDRLIKILGPDAVRAAELSQPEAARLEAISLLEQPLDASDVPLTLTAERTLDALRGESEGLAAMASGGATASGQGGGEGARPDPNASGQAGQPRALPQQIMQRFGELLSQRLLQQVSQGNWRVELDLEPGDLGSIRIELELRKGEIEASIKATQASTRDLLQESLPRLKEALERNGMDVASLSVGQQDRRQSGGQSPSGRQPSGGQASGSDQSSETAAVRGKAAARDDGRLDVWV